LRGDSALYSRDAFGPPLIRIHEDLNPAKAAQELMERLIEATGLVEVRSQLDHSGFANIETLITSYKQSIKRAVAAVAIASELYLAGITIVSEGANLVVTFSDLSEGNYYAAIGFLPLLMAAVGKTGVVLKHGRESLRVSAEALQSGKALPVNQLIALLESTRNLARNMEKAGISRPAGTAAHHIVPAALAKYQSAVEARTILKRFGIGLENAANGVYLPSTLQDVVKAARHGTLHTKKYSDKVLERLATVSSKEEALMALDRIRNDLLRGTFPH
jgi:hypothetical protein